MVQKMIFFRMMMFVLRDNFYDNIFSQFLLVENNKERKEKIELEHNKSMQENNLIFVQNNRTKIIYHIFISWLISLKKKLLKS